jgi:hypothetical protein
MTKQLEYKGHKATLKVEDLTNLTTLAEAAVNDRVVSIQSSLIQATSKPCTRSEAITISAMYTKFWQQAVRREINRKPI